MKLLEISGFLPEVNHCVGCSQTLRNQAYLDAGAGGALCSKCSGGRGRSISIGSLKIMRRLVSTDWTMFGRTRIPASSSDEILSALSSYTTYHTGRELRSAKFLEAVAKLK
jgi:DNA repair protein RecO (recombination protein O)